VTGKGWRTPGQLKAKAESQVRNWKHPIGTHVTVHRDNGGVLHTVTRSDPWVMEGHSAVIMVKGISGGYALERVKPSRCPECGHLWSHHIGVMFGCNATRQGLGAEKGEHCGCQKQPPAPPEEVARG